MRLQVTVSILCLAVIGGGARFAIAKERFRHDDFLQAEYQAINKDYYGGQLPTIPVKWADLPSDRLAETGIGDYGPYVINVDPLTVSDCRGCQKRAQARVVSRFHE